MEDKHIIASGVPDARLSTGMTLREATARASDWWQRSGRKMMIDMRAHQKKKNRLEFTSQNPEDPNYMPSGILHAVEWDSLTEREKYAITAQWHSQFIYAKDVMGIDNPQYKFGGRITI